MSEPREFHGKSRSDLVAAIFEARSIYDVYCCSRAGNLLRDRMEELPWWCWLERRRLRWGMLQCFDLAGQAEFEIALSLKLREDAHAMKPPELVDRRILKRLKEEGSK